MGFKSAYYHWELDTEAALRDLYVEVRNICEKLQKEVAGTWYPRRINVIKLQVKLTEIRAVSAAHSQSASVKNEAPGIQQFLLHALCQADLRLSCACSIIRAQELSICGAVFI